MAAQEWSALDLAARCEKVLTLQHLAALWESPLEFGSSPSSCWDPGEGIPVTARCRLGAVLAPYCADVRIHFLLHVLIKMHKNAQDMCRPWSDRVFA